MIRMWTTPAELVPVMGIFVARMMRLLVPTRLPLRVVKTVPLMMVLALSVLPLTIVRMF